MMRAYLLILLVLVSCSSEEKRTKRKNLTGEYLFRHHDEYISLPPAPRPQTREKYPWEKSYIGSFPRITKEFFRCKGNFIHPIAIQKREGKDPLYYRDCQRHGLPMRDNKEFVYPCLIDILNFIQEKTHKRVVITCGHRCPKHNSYSDPSRYNWGSKHMLGAEVDFYVEGMEEEPHTLIELVKSYYQEHYPNQSKWTEFVCYEQDNLNVSTPAIYNKEVFVKLYKEDEGRDFDNDHPYPYVGIQARYDRDLKERVRFDQTQAQNYLRR